MQNFAFTPVTIEAAASNGALGQIALASSCDEFFAAVQQQGCRLFVGLKPYLHSLPQETAALAPEALPYALGTSMVVLLKMAEEQTS